MKNLRNSFMLGICGAAIVNIMPAHAQTGAAESQSASQLEEITVTAQRRDENLQNVPIAVSVLSASTTASMGVTGTANLAAAVPGLEFTRSYNSATPALRGVGTSPTVGVGDETAIATYIDGVYLATPSSSLFSFNSIERIEVLKGPQGTLFGRNATGGVVQVVTKDPKHDPSVDLAVGYANYNTFSASFYGTTGLSENLAADLAVSYSNQADGWGKNLFTGTDVYKSREFAIRSKWLFTPGDNTKITLAVDYSRSRTDQGVATRPAPGHFFLDLGATGFAGFYNTNEGHTSFARVRQGGVSLKIDQDLDWANLVSISSYRRDKSLIDADQDHTPMPLLDLTWTAKSKTFTQELQLLSPEGSAVKWIAGAFLFRDISSYEPERFTNPTTFFPPFTSFVTTTIFNKQKSWSYAGFGQATVDVMPDTRLTGGLRYTVDRREAGGTVTVEPGGTAIVPTKKAKFPKLTWKVSLDHDFGPNILGYATYSRGFKSGIFSLPDPGSDPVKPSVLDAYEIGFKSDLIDRRLRLNVSAYYYDFKNIQVATGVGQNVILVNAAKSRSKGFDVDLEALPFENFRLRGAVSYIDSKFRNFTNSTFNTPSPFGGNIQTIGDASGNRTPRSPEWTASVSGQYTIGAFDLNLSYYYNDGFFWDAQNSFRNPSYHLVNSSVNWTSDDQNWKVSLWGKNLLKEKYNLYGSINALVTGEAPAAPRTYGVTVGYHWN